MSSRDRTTVDPIRATAAAAVRKKPYTAPRLVELGSVAQLTAGHGSLPTTDGFSNKHRKK